MRVVLVDAVLVEIDRLRNAIIRLQGSEPDLTDPDDERAYDRSKYAAAVRRSSMDLSRALSELRRG